jgi:hypothetical protein
MNVFVVPNILFTQTITWPAYGRSHPPYHGRHAKPGVKGLDWTMPVTAAEETEQTELGKSKQISLRKEQTCLHPLAAWTTYGGFRKGVPTTLELFSILQPPAPS